MTVCSPPGEPTGSVPRFEELYDRMGRLWEPPRRTGVGCQRAPLADVKETDDAYQVELDLPGGRREGMSVDVDNRELRLGGDVKDTHRDSAVCHQTHRT